MQAALPADLEDFRQVPCGSLIMTSNPDALVHWR